MPVIFQTDFASWVLVVPTAAPNLVLHPSVLQAAGGQPSSVVQLADVAVAEFPNLQVSFLQVAPQRYHFTVIERGSPRPTQRLLSVAGAAFRHALEIQPAIALGFNYTRLGTVAVGSAGRAILRLLGASVIEHAERSGHPLLGAGVKLFYDDDPWRVSLTIEPHATNPSQVVANANFHLDNPPIKDPAADLDRYLSQVDRFHDSFSRMAEVILEESAHVTAVRSDWTQEPETTIPQGVWAAFSLTDVERQGILRSVIASQALEGVHVSYALASRLLDQALREPFPDIR